MKVNTILFLQSSTAFALNLDRFQHSARQVARQDNRQANLPGTPASSATGSIPTTNAIANSTVLVSSSNSTTDINYSRAVDLCAAGIIDCPDNNDNKETSTIKVWDGFELQPHPCPNAYDMYMKHNAEIYTYEDADDPLNANVKKSTEINDLLTAVTDNLIPLELAADLLRWVVEPDPSLKAFIEEFWHAPLTEESKEELKTLVPWGAAAISSTSNLTFGDAFLHAFGSTVNPEALALVHREIKTMNDGIWSMTYDNSTSTGHQKRSPSRNYGFSQTTTERTALLVHDGKVPPGAIISGRRTSISSSKYSASSKSSTQSIKETLTKLLGKMFTWGKKAVVNAAYRTNSGKYFSSKDSTYVKQVVKSIEAWEGKLRSPGSDRNVESDSQRTEKLGQYAELKQRFHDLDHRIQWSTGIDKEKDALTFIEYTQACADGYRLQEEFMDLYGKAVDEVPDIKEGYEVAARQQAKDVGNRAPAMDVSTLGMFPLDGKPSKEKGSEAQQDRTPQLARPDGAPRPEPVGAPSNGDGAVGLPAEPKTGDIAGDPTRVGLPKVPVGGKGP